MYLHVYGRLFYWWNRYWTNALRPSPLLPPISSTIEINCGLVRSWCEHHGYEIGIWLQQLLIHITEAAWIRAQAETSLSEVVDPSSDSSLSLPGQTVTWNWGQRIRICEDLINHHEIILYISSQSQPLSIQETMNILLDIEKPRFNNTPSDAVRLQLDAELWVKRSVVPVSSTLHSSMTEHPSRLRVQNYELTFEVRSVNMKYSQASSWPKSSTGKLKVHIFFPRWFWQATVTWQKKLVLILYSEDPFLVIQE